MNVNGEVNVEVNVMVNVKVSHSVSQSHSSEPEKSRRHIWGIFLDPQVAW